NIFEKFLSNEKRSSVYVIELHIITIILSVIFFFQAKMITPRRPLVEHATDGVNLIWPTIPAKLTPDHSDFFISGFVFGIFFDQEPQRIEIKCSVVVQQPDVISIAFGERVARADIVSSGEANVPTGLNENERIFDFGFRIF